MKSKKILARFPKRLDPTTLMEIETALGRRLSKSERTQVLESYGQTLAGLEVHSPIIDIELALPRICDEKGQMLSLSGRLLAVDRYSGEYHDDDVTWRIVLTVTCVPIK